MGGDTQATMLRAVVVAQLAEQSILTPEVPGLNSAISNFDKYHLFTLNCLKKAKIKKKGWDWLVFYTKPVYLKSIHLFNLMASKKKIQHNR